MILSHGGSAILQERLCDSSDKFETVVCEKCGLLSERGKNKNQKRYSSVTTHIEEFYCRTCGTGEHVRLVVLPYAFKLFVQEMQASHVLMRLNLKE